MTLTRYTIGFILSLVLTLVVYWLATSVGGGFWMVVVISLLAVVQMIVQLVYFLHLGEEASPRHKLWSFIIMAVTVLIIVFGTLWIMKNMNYNMMNMTPAQKDDYMTSKHEMAF